MLLFILFCTCVLRFCTGSSELPLTCTTNNVLKIDASSGTLLSSDVDRTGCGSIAKPWTLQGSQGQRIRISMTDFAWGSNSAGQCTVYGYVSEADTGMNHTICGGLAREREIYTSNSNTVQLQIGPMGAGEDNAHFMILYQGK